MTDTKQEAIMSDSDDDYEPVEEVEEDRKGKAESSSTLKAPKPARRQWQLLNNVDKALLMQNAEEVKNFDWSEHCKKGESPKQAKQRHWEMLKKKHGKLFTFRNPDGRVRIDKYKIGTLPLFLNSVMNLASVPNNDIPGCLSEYKTGGAAKAKKEKKKSTQKNVCGKCRRPQKNPSDLRDNRCCKCFTIWLEVIWLTLHPKSEWTKIHPINAVAIIEKAILDKATVSELACQLVGDHTKDDQDPNVPYNRKVAGYPFFDNPLRRFQEVDLAAMSFIDFNQHQFKSRRDGDDKKDKEYARLRESRKKATDEYVKTIKVDDLVKFTESLRDEDIGGHNFNLKQFLAYSHAHWKKEAAKITVDIPDVVQSFDVALWKKEAAETTVGIPDVVQSFDVALS